MRIEAQTGLCNLYPQCFMPPLLTLAPMISLYHSSRTAVLIQSLFVHPCVFSELSVLSSSNALKHQSGYFACIIIIQNTHVTLLVQFYLLFKHIFASHTFCKLKTPVIKLRSPLRASTGGCGGGLIACLRGEAQCLVLLDSFHIKLMSLIQLQTPRRRHFLTGCVCALSLCGKHFSTLRRVLIVSSLLLSCWDTVLSCVPADSTREIKGSIVSVQLLFGYMTHIDSERAKKRES